MSDKGTTAIGFENPNQQVNIGPLSLPGTDHGQKLYRLSCRPCGLQYAANGSDIFQRKCPGCQDGQPSTGGWQPEEIKSPAAPSISVPPAPASKNTGKEWKVMSSYHCGVAAEAYAAALFARSGLDVSVQYGANQPEYDLLVSRGQIFLRISVKGSQDGGWGLTQSYIENANYHAAVDSWYERHRPDTVFCFVQFIDTALTDMPRVYLATAKEVAAHLKLCAKGRGDTMLMEKKVWGKKAHAAGTVDQIPDSWKFSPQRIEQLLAAVDVCPACNVAGAKK